MEYGLDGEPIGYQTPHGIAFAAILDGDWTWPVDVLVDGRTAMGPGRWPHRVIDRSVDQRLEKHAMLVSVRRWPHRAFTVTTPTGVMPIVNEADLPPLVVEATGPADLWYADATTALEITLAGWPPECDRWTVRSFAVNGDHLLNAAAVLGRAVDHRVDPGDWCALCGRPLEPATVCGVWSAGQDSPKPS